MTKTFYVSVFKSLGKGSERNRTHLQYWEYKIFYGTTDATSLVVRQNKEFIKLIQNNIGHQLLNFIALYLFHQEGLVAMILPKCLNNVNETFGKIVNLIESCA